MQTHRLIQLILQTNSYQTSASIVAAASDSGTSDERLGNVIYKYLQAHLTALFVHCEYDQILDNHTFSQ